MPAPTSATATARRDVGSAPRRWWTASRDSPSRDAAGGAYWGYDYTWATRSGEVNPRGASTIVPGAFALFALLDDLVGDGRRAHTAR